MMTSRRCLVLALIAATMLVSRGGAAQEGAPEPPADLAGRLNTEGGTVISLALRGPIDAAALNLVKQAVTRVEQGDQVRCLVIHLDTAGGSLAKAEAIAEELSRIKRTCPVYVIVEKQVVGPGVYVCLATNGIFMTARSHLGPAEVSVATDAAGDGAVEARREVPLAAKRATARSLAQENGYPSAVAEAFVDPDVELNYGDRTVARQGQLLSLTAQEATAFIPELGKPLLASGIVAGLDDVLAKLGVADATTVQVGFPGAEGDVAMEAAGWAFKKLNTTGGTVIVIPLEGEIGPALLFSVRRAFDEAEKMKDLRCIIIDMNTPGGRLDVTQEIIDRMRSIRKKCPVYTYVNTWGASAGAILCLASDAVFMAPGSRLGAAMPMLMAPGGGPQEMPADIQEKILSDSRALVRALAQENGYDPELAMAFVDRSVEVKVGDEVICEVGELLALTDHEATKFYPELGRPLFASAIVADVPALLDYVGVEAAEVSRIEITSAEKLARWITALAPLLMLGFLLGIYVEMNTPGFGVPGILAISCLVLMLFGHHVAGLAGYEDMALIFIGLVLLTVEIFVIPGFGFVGLAGIGLIATGLVMAMLPRLPTLPDDTTFAPAASLQPYLQTALTNLAVALAVSVVGMWLLAKYLPRSGPFSKLVLQKSQTVASGYIGLDVAGSRTLIGEVGIALTALRPSGTARVAGKRLDVVSAGDYIEQGERIKVMQVNGPRIEVVRAGSAEAAAAPAKQAPSGQA